MAELKEIPELMTIGFSHFSKMNDLKTILDD